MDFVQRTKEIFNQEIAELQKLSEKFGKLASVLEICEKEGISLNEVAYIGDDINCFELLSKVGLAACPANAIDAVKNIPGIIRMNKKGGEGCVRDILG